jgi:pimeloyl-ACP methyl ester carboxylesterase
LLRWTTTLDDLHVEIVHTARGPIEIARTGAGPAVMLIHGIPGSWRQAVPLGEDLADRFTVLLPSRPGYGRTPAASGCSADDQADLYAATLDALAIDRCAMVGISGGGPSALAFASRHPGRASALVLACALAAHLIDVPRALRLLSTPFLGEALAGLTRVATRARLRDADRVARVLARRLTKDERRRARADRQINDDLVRFALSHAEAPVGVAGLRCDLQEARRARHAPDWSPIACPTLVLHGDRDETVRLSHAEFHATAIPAAQLAVYEEAGHVFLITRRREATEAIRSFLIRAT